MQEYLGIEDLVLLRTTSYHFVSPSMLISHVDNKSYCMLKETSKLGLSGFHISLHFYRETFHCPFISSLFRSFQKEVILRKKQKKKKRIKLKF